MEKVVFDLLKAISGNLVDNSIGGDMAYIIPWSNIVGEVEEVEKLLYPNLPTIMLKINGLDIAAKEGTNWKYRITPEDAAKLAKTGYESIMCREYGEDDDWVGVTEDDLDEDTGLFDEDYFTFEIDG